MIYQGLSLVCCQSERVELGCRRLEKMKGLYRRRCVSAAAFSEFAPFPWLSLELKARGVEMFVPRSADPHAKERVKGRQGKLRVAPGIIFKVNPSYEEAVNSSIIIMPWER